MNVKVLALLVVALFTMGAAVAPAYAQSPQVSVTLDVQPCQGVPAAYALNSTNYAVVQYIQAGQVMTSDVWKNTTISADQGSVMAFPAATNFQLYEPVGNVVWFPHTPAFDSIFVNKTMDVVMSYCPVLMGPTARMLFKDSAYNTSMGTVMTPQSVLGAFGGGFVYLGNVKGVSGVVGSNANTPITSNTTISVPTQWYNATGAWEIQGKNNFNIVSAIESRTLPTFDYTFTPSAKPSLPTWSFNSSTPLTPGGTLTAILSAPYPFYPTSMSTTQDGRQLSCGFPDTVTSISCTVFASSAGMMRITATASVQLSVLAPSPGGTGAGTTTRVANITSTAVQVVQPATVTPWWATVPWWVWLLVIAAIVVATALYLYRKKRRGLERGAIQ